MWFIGVEEEQETSAPPPKKNPGSAPKQLFLFAELTPDLELKQPQKELFCPFLANCRGFALKFVSTISDGNRTERSTI